MTLSEDDLRRSLAHVFWIGGPSDSGKTTVANLLLRRRRWQWYPCDLHEYNHPLICDDLRLMPHKPPVLAEGPRLFPKLIAPVLTSPRQAVWLLPTAPFALASQERRNKPMMRFESSDPERFRENFLARERLLAEHIESEVARLGLPFIEVDGRRTAEEIADEVETHFATYPACV